MDQYGYPFVINVDLDYMLLQNIKKTTGIKMIMAQNKFDVVLDLNITRIGLLNI